MPITLAISSSVSTLKIGESAGVTFTFSEAPVGFTAGDISVAGGTLSGLTNTGGGVYTATFTPNSGVAAGVESISVAAGSYSNALGDLGSAAAVAPISIDTLRPTLAISFDDAALGIGETSLVTFTFSEAVTGFTLGDAVPQNGTLSSLATSDNITWTATLTPAAGVTDTSNLIALDMSGVWDGAGNSGVGTVNSPNYVLDAQRPTATIVMSEPDLKAGETSLVTFTFSEAVTGFDGADLAIANGALSAVTSSDGGITWTATFTPTANVHDTSNVITLNNAGYADLAGNAGTGTTNSANFTVSTVRPQAAIALSDAALGIGETATVTITFTEAVSGFDSADLSVANGQVSSLSSSDGGVTWTATLTPAAGITDPPNVITLDRSGVTNAAGNTGTGSLASSNYAVDTVRPTATVTIANPAMQAGQTSQVTIAFSETVTGFDLADLSVANGVLSNLTSADGGRTWTATLTPTVGISDPTNLVVLATAQVFDLAGNPGAGLTTSNNYQVGYVPPPASEDDVLTTPPGGGAVAAGPGADSVLGGASSDVIEGNTGDAR